jgi:hypothetical protein
MKWSDVDDKWIIKNKETLLLYFKTITIPKFYTDKVLEVFKNLTIDDVEISGSGNSLTYGTVKIRIKSSGSGNSGTVKIRIKSTNYDQVTYYILYSHWRSSEWEGHYDNLEDYTSEFLIKERDKKLGELLGHWDIDSI